MKPINTNFKTIGIFGYPRHPHDLNTHKKLYDWLNQKGINVIIDDNIAYNLGLTQAITGNLLNIGGKADLAIIVGGDGNMLGASRILAKYDIKVIGINHGNLGFLTDLDPTSAISQLSDILIGKYYHEKRFLLEAYINKNNKIIIINTAINEVIFNSGKITNMIEFDVFINNSFAFSQRSDGLIIATPTGSTAYALSAGGPIITPDVDAILLISMFPHTLCSRPLIINGNSIIKLKFSNYIHNLKISFDSQITIPIYDIEEIFIKRSNNFINIIHPTNYNYFYTLTEKLYWEKKSNINMAPAGFEPATKRL